MGFSTESCGFQGAFTHQDFAGHKGTIRTGDVQVWEFYEFGMFLLDTTDVSVSGTHQDSPVCMVLDLILYDYMQWMTAGRGIIHSEMPAGDGVQRGLQLWINLASKDKM